jgi:hypothetical protein
MTISPPFEFRKIKPLANNLLDQHRIRILCSHPKRQYQDHAVRMTKIPQMLIASMVWVAVTVTRPILAKDQFHET